MSEIRTENEAYELARTASDDFSFRSGSAPNSTGSLSTRGQPFIQGLIEEKHVVE